MDRRFINSGLVILILAALIHWDAGSAQSVRTRIQSQSQRLEQLQDEISQFRRQLSSAQQKEQSLIEQLNVLEQDISYTQRLIRQMEEAQQEREARIASLNTQLEEKKAKVAELKERFARRAVHIYKQGRLNDLELLLTSESINQALYRYKYLKVINEADRTLFRAITNTMQQIEDNRAQLRREIEEQETLLTEKRREQQRLENDQTRRGDLLAEVRNDVESHQQAIREREQTIRDIERMIAELERERVERERAGSVDEQRAMVMRGSTVDIPNLKGRLPWPARGEIIARFGKFQHPKLKTTTENPGIDIAAEKGTEVVAVLDGVVTRIDWLRGFGNTIILDHGDGYYTVYTHVIEIQVVQNSYVEAGDIIASVGDSGSLEGPKLHFEIWGNKQKLNPEIWLASIS